MKLSIEVELGNNAMRRARDVELAIAESLGREVARFTGDLLPGWQGSIYDANGNTVGRWEVVDN